MTTQVSCSVDEKLDRVGFASWRPGQKRAATAIVSSLTHNPERPIILTAPPGSGKSLIYSVATFDQFAMTLTSTRALQDQLHKAFPMIYHSVKGRANYTCLVTGAPSDRNYTPCLDTRYQECDQHEECDLITFRLGAKIAANALMNYPLYLLWGRHHVASEARVHVMDEAHAIEGWIEQARRVSVRASKASDIAAFIKLASKSIEDAAEFMVKQHNRNPRKKDPEEDRFEDRLNTILNHAPNVEWDVQGDRLIMAALAVEYDFPSKKGRIFCSATITKQSISPFVGGADPEFIEMPSPFPVESRPFYYLPSAKIDFRSSDRDIRGLLFAIEKILKIRPKSRTLIHCVSYALGQMIHDNLRNLGIDSLFVQGKDRHTAVSRWMSGENRILISPAATEGLDLHDDFCRVQILCKLPWPWTQDRISKAKKRMDKQWTLRHAANTIAQAYGRGVRRDGDHCEFFMLDRNFSWAKNQLWPYLPTYLKEAYREIASPPKGVV